MGSVIEYDRIIEVYYVFGFPFFRTRLIDFHKENQMDDTLGMDTIDFGCGCRAVKPELDESGTTWSLQHCRTCVPPVALPTRYRTITASELENLQRALRVREDELLKVKGVDYTRGGPNRIANFIEAGEALGLDPRIIWMVYFHKHITAVAAWAATGHVESESLFDRFADIRNYCLLGLALDRASRPEGGVDEEDKIAEELKCPL